MKRLLFVLLVFPAMLFAKPVDLNVAQQIAQNFINSSNGIVNVQQSVKQPCRLKRVAEQVADNPPYYIFNNEDGGFVIVSGDDCATPILGYSDEGSIDVDNMPIQLQELLQAYTMEIHEAVENNLQATDEVAESWAAYKKAPQSQTTTATVNALITTSWNQYPLYNDKCPSDPTLSSFGGHPTTGCVATAMAQIMKYWEYPKVGVGNKSYKSQNYGTLSANFANTTYDWANMPLKLSPSTSSTQNNAVTTLMYHCGVAVSMNYNSDGQGSSGANTLDWGGGRASAETALKTYFNYASTLEGKQSASMSASAWKNLLKTELDNKRPMLYRGVSSQGGHAFICDGYDSNDKFHFNWGWGGSANGFYSLTAGTSGCHDFAQDQCAIIGIKPKDGSGPAKNYDLYMNTDLSATNTSSGSSSDVNLYYWGKTISFAAKVENNGAGTFNGSFRVAAFTNDGEFVGWSKESYHFSLEAGHKTVQQTFTFDGGYPFVPGKYRAYLYYKDDDDEDWKFAKYVKTDEGVFLTEYNNVMFTVKMSGGDLYVTSAFNFVIGSNIERDFVDISVNVRNTALLTTFYGLIRLSLYDADGTRVHVIDTADYSSGFSSLTTETLYFTGYLDVDPGSYYLALTYQKSNETFWYYMRSDSYSNPVSIIVKAPPLYADGYENNNTQATATLLSWRTDNEYEDFGTVPASLHEDADIDFYKLEFPLSYRYKVAVSLYDKYNQGGWFHENADAQVAYSIGGDTYSSFFKGNKTITFDGPTTLYFKVTQFGMNGLGYYELAGEIEETPRKNNCKELPYVESFASSKGDFVVQDATLPSGFTHIWNFDSQYGMVAKCIKGSTKYASESWLISPCIDLPTESKCVLTFSHAAKFYQNTSQMTLWVSTDYESEDPSSATWEQLTIPTYPPGTNWTWYNSGEIDLSAYKGQYVNVAFRYTSTADYAPQWEIKNFSIKKSTTPIDEVSIEQSSAEKILENGQIYILRGGKKYTLQGVEVK